MLLWRLTKRSYADLSGRGGELIDGRWHTRGRPVVYCASSAALAVLEVRVHLDLPLDLLPDDYVLVKMTAPDDLPVQAVEPVDLPEGWRGSAGEALCQSIGDSWLAEAPTALLAVPSIIVEVERNLLLNPRHLDAPQVAIEDIIPFGWDQRLFL